MMSTSLAHAKKDGCEQKNSKVLPKVYTGLYIFLQM